MIQVVYGSETLAASFRDAVDLVARERIYIEMIEAFPLEDIRDFVKKATVNDWPIYFALDTAKHEVLGWCDIMCPANPRLAHRRGIEKVELQVYTTNTAAIGLYRKFGFTDIGVTKNYRKLDGRYFDVLHMEKFL